MLQQDRLSQNGANHASRSGVEHFNAHCQRVGSRSLVDPESSERF